MSDGCGAGDVDDVAGVVSLVILEDAVNVDEAADDFKVEEVPLIPPILLGRNDELFPVNLRARSIKACPT